MSFWSRITGRDIEQRASLEDPRTPLSNPAQWLLNIFGLPSASSISVTTESALQSTAVWACVNVLSETIASLPLQVFKSNDKGETEKDINHSLYGILHSRPNPGLTSFRWRRLIMRHLLLHGRHYSRIEFNRGNKVVGLFPLHPNAVTVKRENTGKIIYEVKLKAGGAEKLAADEVLHFTGLDDDEGLDGVSPINKCKDAIGLSLALERFGSKFFANDARPSIIIKHPSRLSMDATENLKKSITENYQGVDNAHKTMVLEEGSSVEKLTIEPENAQFIETRKLQLQEIARIYRVPPVFLQDLERATFSNNEQQDLHFVKHTLRPWLVMLEQEMNLKLLSETEAKTRNIEFNVDGLLRGDFSTRMDGYSKAIQNGVMKPNEARAKENLPADAKGNDLMIQGATVPIGQQPRPAQSPGEKK